MTAIILLALVLCAGAGCIAGSYRNRPAAGLLLGLVLGPLGWVVALFLPPPVPPDQN